VLEVLASILGTSSPPPAIAPMADGRLQLAWYDAGLELEITVAPDGEVDIGLYDLRTRMEEGNVFLSDIRLAEAIRRLSAP
jgi:hypothetical protein